MRANKITAILYFVASILFYISAILNFIGSDSGIGVVYLCVGSTSVCLGSMYLLKSKKDDNKSNGKHEIE